MSTSIPTCRYCHKPYKLMRETNDFWEMACEDCKVGHVFSKPSSRDAARYRLNLQRQLDLANRRRLHEARPVYSIPSPKRG